MKQTHVNTQQYITLKINLKTYNGILRRSIRVAKTMYYHTTFEKCKHDIKETCSTLKTIIQKKKTGGKLPDYFKIDGNIVNDKQVIANKCNTFFFTNIGPTLASQINVEGIQSYYAGYLKHPCCNTFSFKSIDVITTKNKTITGFFVKKNIDCVNNFNFLGIVLNHHLNWHSHTNKIANKICKIIGILNKLKHSPTTNTIHYLFLSSYTSSKLWHFIMGS